MPQGFVVLGDCTTHGGTVISASSTIFIHGRPVALVGDQVDCPKLRHGVNLIVEGCPDWSEDGRAVVVTGCRSECGCQIVAGTFDCTVG